VIGTRLSAAVVATEDNVCPRFMPAEFGIAAVDR
jgi:pseudouridine kinase